MDIEKEIDKLNKKVKLIIEDITNLKELLYRNYLLQYGDFLSNTEKAAAMNKKYTCLICGKEKTFNEFNEYNIKTGKGICKLCYDTHFPSND